MKWKEVTQFSELLSSESSVNNANQINNNANHLQKEKTLSFTSKTDTILRQVWESKFIFTKRSLVCYLLGRNIKIPDQHGRRPPATIKGYLAFQNEKIVQMFVSQMIAKQIFIQKKIQTQSKRSKHIIVPMSLNQYYLLKNSNLSQKLAIQIPLSVIMNQEIKAKNGQKKQSRFSQFLVTKKQIQTEDQDCSEFCKIKSNEHQKFQQQKKSCQNSKQKQMNLQNRIRKFQHPQKFELKKSKVPTQQFQYDKKNKKNQEQNLLQRRENQFSQKINLVKQQEKTKQFWLKQNQLLLQQFGYIKDSLNEEQKNINEMQSKQQMILMMKQIKDKQKAKKINIPNYFFLKSQNRFSDNNNFQRPSKRNEFVIQNNTRQQNHLESYEKRQKIESMKVFNGKFIQKSQKKIVEQIFINQEKLCLSVKSNLNKNVEKNYKNIQKQQFYQQNRNQAKIFSQTFKNITRQTQKYYQNKKQAQNSQQSRTITLQNHRFRNNQNDRRSSGNSNHSDSIQLKQYFDSGQIGKFWDQIFENPKFNYQLTQKSIKYSECVQIPEESQNTQTMTLQKSRCKEQYNIANHDCDFRDISYQLNTSFPQQVNFQQNNQSFPQQTIFQLNNQNFILSANYQQNSYDKQGGFFFQVPSSFKKNQTFKHNNSYINQKQSKNWRMSNCQKNSNVKQQNNFKHEQHPQLYQISSDYSDTFDKTKTILISNNKNIFNFHKQLQFQDFENKKFNKSSNIYLPQKIQIEYPKQIEQVQRSTYTLTVGRNSADSFYYSSEKQKQKLEFQGQGYEQSELCHNHHLYQKKHRQNFCQNTITLARKDIYNQQLQNLWLKNKQKPYNQYQNYKELQIKNQIQELDI